MEGSKMGDESYIEVGWIFRWGNNIIRDGKLKEQKIEGEKLNQEGQGLFF